MLNAMSDRIQGSVALRSQPHNLLSARVDDVRGGRYSEPAKRMMMAILRQAIADFQKNVGGKGRGKRKRFREAKNWIFEEATDWIFSFANICEVLRLSPDFLRGQLLRSSARKLRNR